MSGPPPEALTWHVPHEPSPYTALRFVRYWDIAKDPGTPSRTANVNKNNTTTIFLFIYRISFSFWFVTFRVAGKFEVIIPRGYKVQA